MSVEKRSLDRESWLEHALTILRDEGIHGVRIERLARDLGVTKGSFYWHFSDRDDLHRNILKYWADAYNDVVIEDQEILNARPADGLLILMMRVREDELDRYEVAIRAWAAHDRNVRAIVAKVDSRRKRLVSRLFTQMGFSGVDAELRTRLTLCYLSWESSMYPDEPAARQRRFVRLHHELLTKR